MRIIINITYRIIDSIDSMDAKSTQKRIQAKGWFLTWPKCDVPKEKALELLKLTGAISEYVIAREVHADGDFHLHAFLKYERKVDFKSDKWDLGSHHGNYQVAKSWRAVERYCKKDGDYISSLDLLSACQKKAKNNQELLSMSAKEAVLQGKINLLQLPALIKAKGMYDMLEEAKDCSDVRGIWYWGKPGVGKSHRAREENPSLYIKAQNKWWDGYRGQEAVLLDDLDKGGSCLGHYLKIWADKYACTGEIKGATVPLNHQRFIVTSNYTPAQLWPDDMEMQEAVARRFKLVEVFSYKSELN